MRRWSSAASRRACAASRITITGRTRCGARCCPTRRPTCCCSATPSARWWNSRTAWPRAKTSRPYATCAAAPSWCPAAGGRRLDRGRFDHGGYAGRDPCAPRPLRDGADAAAEARQRADDPFHGRDERLAARGRCAPSTVVRLPSYEQVRDDPVLYAHASRTFHLESNPGNARALVQGHADRDVWLNPPPIPLTTPEMDHVYGLPYARAPHPAYGDAKIPAWEMIRFSVNIMRGCFGGCTFCSITEHEGRIIQSRSEASILHEIEEIRDKTRGLHRRHIRCRRAHRQYVPHGVQGRRDRVLCRRLSCVYPGICDNLNTDHAPLIGLYRKARALPGIKKVLVASGLRYDLAVRSPEYVKELATHHVGGYLKIAPEHIAEGPLSKMMKPGVGSLRQVQGAVRQVLARGGQGAVPDPLLHRRASGHHRRGHARAGAVAQAQRLSPGPGADLPAHAAGAGDDHVPHRQESAAQGVGAHRRKSAWCAAAASGGCTRPSCATTIPENWPLLREALQRMGRADLIGNGKKHLIPSFQPAGTGKPLPRAGGRQPAGRAAPVRRAAAPPKPGSKVKRARRP